MIQDVEPKGNRLDDADIEACMLQALKAMPVGDLLPLEHSASEKLAAAISSIGEDKVDPVGGTDE